MSVGQIGAASRAIDTSDVRSAIIEKIVIERARQIHKWGWQRHPDGTEVNPENTMRADVAKFVCEVAAKNGRTTWIDILNEEIAEAYAEDPSSKELMTELIQSAAVILAWLEDLATR